MAAVSLLIPVDCPRFQTCNASICPLDPLWPSAVHLRGEKVCPYLLGSGKAGADEKYQGDPVFAACLARLPDVTAAHPDIARRVEKAARTAFKKGQSAEHLARAREARRKHRQEA